MALLNENRNRTPLIPAAPVNGMGKAIRGQLRMLELQGDVALYVCTIDGTVSIPATLTTGGLDLEVSFTSIEESAAANAITVEFVDPAANDAALSVVVTVNAIVVNLATGPGGVITSTALDVRDAINSDMAASLLVVADNGDGTGLDEVIVVAAMNLANGDAVALPGDLTIGAADLEVSFTSIEEDLAANMISVEFIDPAANDAVLSVDVTMNAIVVNLGTDGLGAITSTALNIRNIINSHPSASLLVVADNGVGTGLDVVVAAPAANLINGTSGTFWVVK